MLHASAAAAAYLASDPLADRPMLDRAVRLVGYANDP